MTFEFVFKSDAGLSLVIDFSRPPNDRERGALTRRLARLKAAAESITEASAQMQRLASSGPLDDVRIRHGFIRLEVPTGPDTSSRNAPKPEHRPPSTRLMSPNGIALRFYLIALLEAQSRTKPGARPLNPTPLRGSSTVTGWTNYIATAAKPSGAGRHRMGVIDKKLRQLQTTLNRLASTQEQLVDLPHSAKKQGQHEGFLLMREDARTGITNDLYTVPDEGFFTVPVSLFTNGWIYVLEDSELALLLLIARMRYQHGEASQRLAAGTRQNLYGLGRDAFEAHHMLHNLGIAHVTPDEARSLTGKVKDYETRGALPHELLFLPKGLEKPALPEVVEQIEYQLDR
ncbi:hypothetical protein ACIO14_05585 [Nocardia fluminea]|uniref:hypothetical protein n=1 Tax=Nocardia fluminea TaxID=134984 RepID=UPI003801D751